MLFLLSSSSSSLLLLSLSLSSSPSSSYYYYHYYYYHYYYYYYYHYYSVNNIPYQCDINCAGHFTLDALASRTVAWFYWRRLSEIGIRISNHIRGFIRDVITHPCPNFNGGLAASPLNYGVDELLRHTVCVDVITYPCPKLGDKLVELL